MSDDPKTPPIHNEGMTSDSNNQPSLGDNELTQALDDILHALDSSSDENLPFSRQNNEPEAEFVLNEPTHRLQPETSPKDDEFHQIDWVTLASKLREQNRQLIQTVVQLEQALAQARQEQQDQSRRWRNSDTILSQQSAELQKAHKQMSYLGEQLEASQAEAHRQHLKTETLSEQLEAVQRQMAQLEREYTLLHETHQHKLHLLNTAQQDIRELQTRLQRQQRYTLQYKTALDHALGKGGDIIEATQPSVSSMAIQPWKSEENEESFVLDSLASVFISTLTEEETVEATAIVPEETTSLTEPDRDTDTSSIDESPSGGVEPIKSPSFNMKIPKHPQLHHSPKEKLSATSVIIDLPNFLRNRSS